MYKVIYNWFLKACIWLTGISLYRIKCMQIFTGTHKTFVSKDTSSSFIIISKTFFYFSRKSNEPCSRLCAEVAHL